MRIPRFREAVVIGDSGIVYVFPLGASNATFVWDAEEAGGDWANWFVIADNDAFKVTLHVGNKPYATVDPVDEY